MKRRLPIFITRWLLYLGNVLGGTRVRREGSGHRVSWGTARVIRTRIEFHGTGGCVELGEETRLWDCQIILRGTAPRLRIGGHVRLTGVRIVVEDKGSEAVIGNWTSMTRATVQAKEGRRVEFGRDCMVGHGAEVTNSDSHSLLDAATGARLNPARDVIIGEHVWIGAGATVTKGVRIDAGSVVASGSRVFKDVPAGVLVAGTPAVVKRSGITWSRKRLGVEP